MWLKKRENFDIMQNYHLSIITPNGKVFEGEVEALTAPGSEGTFQVLARHAPLTASLKKGTAKIKQNGEEKNLMIKNGILEVDGKNRVLLLTDEANFK